MAIAVASTSGTSGTDQTSLVVTAPTGIATGDILLFIVAHGGSFTTVTSTGFTQYLRYAYDGGSEKRGTVTYLYKYAVLADESATDYTVTVDTAEYLGAAVMLRIPGGITSGDPIWDYYVGSGNVSTSGGLQVSDTVDIIRPTAQLNLIIATAWSGGNFTGEITNDNYSIVSADANPSWTEISEQNFRFGGTLNDYGRLTVAYATSTATSDVTGITLDYDEVSLDDATGALYFYFVLATPQAASGSNTLVTATSATFSGSGVTNVSAGNTLATATGASLAQTGKGTSPTPWSHDTKPSTTWTNETL